MRYEIQGSSKGGDGFRVTDTKTDSRVATCYLRENAQLVTDALNRPPDTAAERERPTPKRISLSTVGQRLDLFIDSKHEYTIYARPEDGPWHGEKFAQRFNKAQAVLDAERDALRAENQCDACTGTGTPISRRLCMCDGTGKMSVAARYLRERLVTVESDRDRLAARVGELEGERDRGQQRYDELATASLDTARALKAEVERLTGERAIDAAENTRYQEALHAEIDTFTKREAELQSRLDGTIDALSAAESESARLGEACREVGHGQETALVGGMRERACDLWGYDLCRDCPICSALRGVPASTELSHLRTVNRELVGALDDFVRLGEQEEWDKATTGRQILMAAARAALAKGRGEENK